MNERTKNSKHPHEGRKFETYSLYWAKDFRTFKQTTLTFKGRTQQEAMNKAKKFWEDGQMGAGSIKLEPCELRETL